MVSLYIPAVAKLIERATSPAEVFALLRKHWYVSRRGLSHRDRFLALVQETTDAFPRLPQPGRERSREIMDALARAGYLSILGRTWGMRFQDRR